MSLIKPNIFSSILAYSTLYATGDIPIKVQKSFYSWMENIRSDTGYWTSASGKTTPFPGSSSWSRNNNLRHTAKCLDYHLLDGQFGYQDAQIFNEIITCQLEDGSFPQFKGMDSDLWSTAYFCNLLIRATMEQNLKATLPRGFTINLWKNKLNNILNRAIGWLIHKLDTDSMWHIQDADNIRITIAMMVEIGGYLALHAPDTCAAIIRSLMKTQSQKASFVYIACLTIDTLTVQEQALVIKYYEEILNSPDIHPADLIEATSLCKLHFFNKNIGLLLYYRNISHGHESRLLNLEKWNHNAYFCWMLQSIYSGQIKENTMPLQEADFWQYINKSINTVKNTIENTRGWQLLWNKETPVSEEKVQIYINGQLQSSCEADNVSVNRELETGRGPVDFTFSNSFVSKCMMEIKLASNAALGNGNFLAQIYEYAKGLKVSSAFLVIIGFYPDSKNIMDKVNSTISKFRETHTDFYVQTVYIDATQKKSASKINLDEIKEC